MLHPARDGMMRLYSNRDRARLTIIVRLKRLGLPLADIREILDLYALNDGKRAQTRMMLEKFRKQARELEVQRQDIDTALTELYKGIDWLQGIVENPGPSEESKRQAAAYEQVARKQLDEV
jgi:DNA-binding transcriptional MerR regulator